MKPVADLHIHTTASDGLLSVPELPTVAANAGLHTVAVTDHDRLCPTLEDPIQTIDGITVIRGIELKVAPASAPELDLLAYAVRETTALSSLLEEIQADRKARGRRMIALVENHLDITLDITIRTGIGRPHIARAVAAHAAVDLDETDVFRELIGDSGPCYVERTVPSLERAVAILDEACPVIAVAHPLRATDPDAALDIARRVGAVERWYAYRHPVDETPVIAAIEENDLLATGGSDAHGRTLGTAGVPRDDFAPIASALGLSG